MDSMKTFDRGISSANENFDGKEREVSRLHNTTYHHPCSFSAFEEKGEMQRLKLLNVMRNSAKKNKPDR